MINQTLGFGIQMHMHVKLYTILCYVIYYRPKLMTVRSWRLYIHKPQPPAHKLFSCRRFPGCYDTVPVCCKALQQYPYPSVRSLLLLLPGDNIVRYVFANEHSVKNKFHVKTSRQPLLPGSTFCFVWITWQQHFIHNGIWHWNADPPNQPLSLFPDGRVACGFSWMMACWS